MSSFNAFPKPAVFDGCNQQIGFEDPGMSLKEYYMAHAPITLQDARSNLCKTFSHEPSQVEIMAELATMRLEYAEAMVIKT